jgi:hypothetical protein
LSVQQVADDADVIDDVGDIDEDREDFHGCEMSRSRTSACRRGWRASARLVSVQPYQGWPVSRNAASGYPPEGRFRWWLRDPDGL